MGVRLASLMQFGAEDVGARPLLALAASAGESGSRQTVIRLGTLWGRSSGCGAMTAHPAVSKHATVRLQTRARRIGWAGPPGRSSALVDHVLANFVESRGTTAVAQTYGRWSFTSAVEEAVRFAAKGATPDRGLSLARRPADGVLAQRLRDEGDSRPSSRVRLTASARLCTPSLVSLEHPPAMQSRLESTNPRGGHPRAPQSRFVAPTSPRDG